MTDNYDSKWTFTDKQGETFYVWAGSETEAWKLGKAESNYRDEAYKAKQEAAAEAHSARVCEVINLEYNKTQDWHNREISRENNLPHIPHGQIDEDNAMHGNGSLGDIDFGTDDPKSTYPAVTREGATVGTALIAILFCALCMVSCWAAGIPNWFN